MKTKSISTILIFTVLTLTGYSQNTKFKLLIISPDTAVTESSVTTLKEEYERKRRDEETKRFADQFRGKRMDVFLQEVNALTFYKIIANVSGQSIQFFCSGLAPKMKYFQTSGFRDYEKLSKSYKSDYILTFHNIYAHRDTIGLPTLTYTIKLFSTKDKKIILEKIVTGDTINRGDMFGCLDDFMCIVNNSMKQFVGEVAITMMNDSGLIK